MNSNLSKQDWQTKAAALALDVRPFIDGLRVEAVTTTSFEVFDPQTDSLVATLPDCGQADVDRAVASARESFVAGTWSELAPSQRRVILNRLADLITANAEELALLDTLQMGMPIAESLPGIAVVAEMVREAADLADKSPGLLMPSAPTTLATSMRRPHGVVAAITPWNFPLYVAVSKVAPALAAGNSVVLKPSENAPLACLRLADLAFEAGVPAGALNALPGCGPSTGRALALHDDVDCLAFVGSTATGLTLMQLAGQSNMKALLLECGGKSPQIVFDDLGDIEGLADAVVRGFIWNSGQVCIAGTRILIADALYDRLMPLLIARVSATATGHPLDPATTLGPLATQAQFARVNSMLNSAPNTDRLLAQGQALCGSNCAVAPRLYESTDGASPLVQEEIFGPVAVAMRFRDEAHALALANDSRYGLAATVWSSDFKQANRFVASLRAGQVNVNTVAQPRPSLASNVATEPVGISGFGADGGLAGLLAFTRLRSVLYHLA